MIRALRRRHRLAISLLAVVTPVVFVLALAGRVPMPQTRLPPELTARADSALRPIGVEWTLLMNPPIRARYLAPPGDSTPVAIQLTPEGRPTQPDLLLYWTETAGDSTPLPPHAILLGPLHPEEPVRLPPRDRARAGYLLLYSLAHRERVALAKLPPVSGGGPPGP